MRAYCRVDRCVRARLVEPRYWRDTRFAEDGAGRMQGLVTEPYDAFALGVFEGFSQVTAATRPIDVAQAVWQAANDASGRLRFVAGADAVALSQQA